MLRAATDQNRQPPRKARVSGLFLTISIRSTWIMYIPRMYHTRRAFAWRDGRIGAVSGFDVLFFPQHSPLRCWWWWCCWCCWCCHG